MTMANEISRRGQPRGGGSRESPVEQQELRALKHANREWLEERSPNRRVTSHAPMHGGGRTHSQGVSPKRGVLALYLGVFTLRKYPSGGRYVMWLHVVRFGKNIWVLCLFGNMTGTPASSGLSFRLRALRVEKHIPRVL